MDFEWAHALPIGILMFLGTVLGFTRRRASRLRAQRNYPALAERMGLSFEPPRYDGWVGQMRGKYEGYDVLVQPDERARMVVYLQRDPGVELRSFALLKRAPKGFGKFSLGERALDTWLQNRFCDERYCDVLGDDDDLVRALSQLHAKRDSIKQFSVDRERIECAFDFGSPPVIPVGEVERILPLLVSVAQQIDKHFERPLVLSSGPIPKGARQSLS